MLQEPRDCSADRWAALGEHLIRRRVELSPRYHKRTVFAREQRFPYKLICEFEQHTRRNFGPATIIAIEHIYKLRPGFIRRFLNGCDDADDEPNGAAA